MQVLQNTANYQPLARHPATARITFIPTKGIFLTSQTGLPISTGNSEHNVETPVQAEHRLVALGKEYATRLAEILDQLKIYNEIHLNIEMD